MFNYNETLYDINMKSYNIRNLLHVELYSDMSKIEYLCRLIENINIVESCKFIEGPKQIIVTLNDSYYQMQKYNLIKDNSILCSIFRSAFIKFIYDNKFNIENSQLWENELETIECINIESMIDFLYNISILNNAVIINL